jgi:hypothetical protein
VVGDKSQLLCLDYLAQPNAQDLIAVQRDPNGLLSSISTTAEDKTPEIAAKLIQTGEYLAIAAGRSARSATSGDSVDLEFDPFNWDELIAVKRALKRFGFCAYIEGYSFRVPAHDPADALAVGRAWCSSDNPARPALETDEYSSLPVPPEIMRTGVLYRPNKTFKLVILRRPDPGGKAVWQLYQTKRLDMPNVSPVLSVGVDRAVFATRKTTLNFNKGVLTDVAINKGSELVGFVSIPLALAKAIVDVPGQIVTLRITDTNNQTQLLAAQTQLIEAIASYKVTTGAAGVTIPGRSASLETLRRTEIYAACRDAGGGAACGTLPSAQ